MGESDDPLGRPIRSEPRDSSSPPPPPISRRACRAVGDRVLAHQRWRRRRTGRGVGRSPRARWRPRRRHRHAHPERVGRSADVHDAGRGLPNRGRPGRAVRGDVPADRGRTPCPAHGDDPALRERDPARRDTLTARHATRAARSLGAGAPMQTHRNRSRWGSGPHATGIVRLLSRAWPSGQGSVFS